MDSSLDLCISCGAVVFNNTPYCSGSCYALDGASTRAIFAPRYAASARSSSSEAQHDIPSTSSAASSSRWPGNGRAGIESWAKGVWPEQPVVADDEDGSSDVLSLTSSNQSKRPGNTRRRRSSPLPPVSSFHPAPQLLLTARQPAAPALSGFAPLSRSSAGSTDDDGSSLLTPSSTSSVSIPIPSVSKSHQYPINTVASKVRAWVMPSHARHPHVVVHESMDPWISSPPYHHQLARDVPTIRNKHSQPQPARGRPLLRPDW